MFVVAGLYFLYMAAVEFAKPRPDWQQIAGVGLMGTIFVLVPSGIFLALKRQRRRVEAAKKVRDEYPDSPWLWKDEWRAKRIACAGKGGVVATWCIAIFWNVVSAPAAFAVRHEVFEKENYAALLALLFPLIGIGLLYGAVYVTKRWKKFGRSWIELKKLPLPVGQYTQAILHTESPLIEADEMQAQLTCLRRWVVRSGKNNSTREKVYWQDDFPLKRVKGLTEEGRSLRSLLANSRRRQGDDHGQYVRSHPLALGLQLQAPRRGLPHTVRDTGLRYRGSPRPRDRATEPSRRRVEQCARRPLRHRTRQGRPRRTLATRAGCTQSWCRDGLDDLLHRFGAVYSQRSSWPARR